MKKTKFVYYCILAALFAVLFSSTTHVAFTYNSIETYAVEGVSQNPLEQKDISFMSYIAAIGFELSVLALGWSISERRRDKESTKDLLVFLWFFTFINFFCNFYFAISVNTKIPNLKMDDILKVDSFILFKHGLLAGSLPIVALSLLEVQSIFRRKILREERKAAEDLKKQLKRESVLKTEPKPEETPKVTSESSFVAEPPKEDEKKNFRVEHAESFRDEENQFREVKPPLKELEKQLAAESEIVRIPEESSFPGNVFESNRRRIPLKPKSGLIKN